MRIDVLRAHHLRCFQAVEITPGPRLNWLIGANGAGKTTLLEAVYLLSHGHSFRAGSREALIEYGQPGFDVYTELTRGDARHRIGLARSAQQWQIRIDGEPKAALAPLLEVCAVVCFEPGSQALITGGAEQRRRFLDWGVFHVEHSWLSLWRDYRRALAQRNALLKSGNGAGQFGFWEAELGRLAEKLELGRRSYFDALEQHLSRTAGVLLPELGAPRVDYRKGWPQGQALDLLLAEQRDRDIARGYTRLGPHHADWRLEFEHAPGREFLSRGQTKLAALACALAQAVLFAEHSGEWPLLCLDDLLSELDIAHQHTVLEWIAEQPVQVWLTATHIPESSATQHAEKFHVERGVLRRA